MVQRLPNTQESKQKLDLVKHARPGTANLHINMSQLTQKIREIFH